ncbi:hypothetical protein V8F20_001604 [Naviculisporaceae sp. PSN 640]
MSATSNMHHIRYSTPHERPRQEMCEKGRRETLFTSMASMKNRPRPTSVYTEFMESDWEMEEDPDAHVTREPEDDEEIYSEIEDLDEVVEDGQGSPRSSGQPSFTTLSSYDEVQTPRSLRHRQGFFEHDMKQVEGPRGPHLFRSSVSSANSAEFQHALSLSPITPKDPVARQMLDQHLQNTVHLTPLPSKKLSKGPFQYADEELDTATLPDWSPEMVAQWMLNAGVELAATDRFVENDINGAILITLKFEDLKELGIPSFGIRTKIWEEIHAMRNIKKPEPMVETPIEDEPAREVRREMRRQESVNAPKRRPSKARPKINDVISPLESVSIVGIEQMMPKPHRCSKGENCPKWKRNQRMIEAFKKDHPFVDVENGGVIMVAGDPGNPETAEAIRRADDAFRPVSDAIPSVVASSDVMGPGSLPPLQYLQEATLRSIQQRDPQDNVRQFLDFQKHQLATSSEVPPTPPFEIFPQHGLQRSHTSHAGLRALPKLAIPGRSASVPIPAQEQQQPMSAHPRSARVADQPIPSFREMSPSEASEEATPTAVYRFGTPFSEMDVPVTVQALPPVSRDFSQSVPPDMNYRHNPAPQQPPNRSMSRATIRRPSFPVLPALDENRIVTPVTHKPARSFSQRLGQRPLQPPPRVQYPWTQADRTTFEHAIAPLPGSAAASGVATVKLSSTTGGRLSPVTTKPSEDMTTGGNRDAISYQGLMKKRKTKMLRHEWHEHFFTLRGTRLTMHKDAETAANKTLEYIDIDDYAIACSSLASSKLNAAFKAMHLRRGSGDGNGKDDVAAFSFQLIPQDPKGGVRLRKRESTLPGILGGGGAVAGGASNAAVPPGLEGAVNGTGKTHHFAVKGRDERIDWMRELMLAKALKQKGEGFEVSVNGNMI